MLHDLAEICKLFRLILKEGSVKAVVAGEGVVAEDLDDSQPLFGDDRQQLFQIFCRKLEFVNFLKVGDVWVAHDCQNRFSGHFVGMVSDNKFEMFQVREALFVFGQMLNEVGFVVVDDLVQVEGEDFQVWKKPEEQLQRVAARQPLTPLHRQRQLAEIIVENVTAIWKEEVLYFQTSLC